MKHFLILTIACCFISNISNNPISSNPLESSSSEYEDEGIVEPPTKLAKTTSLGDKGKLVVGSTKKVLKMGTEFALGSPVFPAPAKIAIGTAKSAVDGTKTLYKTKSLDAALKASKGTAKAAIYTGADFAMFNPAVPTSVKIAIGTGRALVDGTRTYCKTKNVKETGKTMAGSTIDSANKVLLPAYYSFTRSGYNLMNDFREGKDSKPSIVQRCKEASYGLPIVREVKIGADLLCYLYSKMCGDKDLEKDSEYVECRNSVFDMLNEIMLTNEASTSNASEVPEIESNIQNDNKSEGSGIKLLSKRKNRE